MLISPAHSPLPQPSQASIVTVIHLVNSAVDTVEREGTLLLLPSASSFVIGVGMWIVCYRAAIILHWHSALTYAFFLQFTVSC